MSVNKKSKGILHDTAVNLYESHLEGYEGKLFARTVNDQIIGYERICDSAKERGGFTGNVQDLKNHVAVFFDEAGYLIKDGYRVNLGGLIGAGLDVGGWVENEYAPIDPETNKVRLGVWALPGSRDLVEGVNIVNKGLAPVQNYIMSIFDAETEESNLYLTKDGLFTLFGHRIKIVGDPNKTGVFFYLPGTPNVVTKAKGKLATNEPSKLVGRVPELTPGKDWYIEVRTFYSGNTSRPLKELRIIRSKFTIRQAA
ncbi:MAG: DUF4469 domain-containing protein [Spirochaetaceae bacterium]|nr:DUF4469 domain-containing protein [Spirochaetaceae bacterium]